VLGPAYLLAGETLWFCILRTDSLINVGGSGAFLRVEHLAGSCCRIGMMCKGAAERPPLPPRPPSNHGA